MDKALVNNIVGEDWYWNLIEGSNFQPLNFEDKILGLSKGELGDYIVFHFLALEKIYVVDSIEIDGIGPLSEDSVDDLYSWVISQGRLVWDYACKNPDWNSLFEISHKYSEKKAKSIGLQFGVWDNRVKNDYLVGYQSVEGVLSGVYFHKYGKYYDIDKLLQQRGICR